MVPNVMLYPPNIFAAIVTPVAFATKCGQRWHVAHLLQLTNEGSRMERGRVFISKSHRLFREVLQASVEIGSIFRHRFFIPSQTCSNNRQSVVSSVFGSPVVDGSVGCLSIVFC